MVDRLSTVAVSWTFVRSKATSFTKDMVCTLLMVMVKHTWFLLNIIKVMQRLRSWYFTSRFVPIHHWSCLWLVVSNNSSVHQKIAPPSLILVDQPKIGKQTPISPLLSSPGQLPSSFLHLFLGDGSLLFAVACSGGKIQLLVWLCRQAVDLVKVVISVEARKTITSISIVYLVKLLLRYETQMSTPPWHLERIRIEFERKTPGIAIVQRQKTHRLLHHRRPKQQPFKGFELFKSKTERSRTATFISFFGILVMWRHAAKSRKTLRSREVCARVF